MVITLGRYLNLINQYYWIRGTGYKWGTKRYNLYPDKHLLGVQEVHISIDMYPVPHESVPLFKQQLGATRQGLVQ